MSLHDKSLKQYLLFYILVDMVWRGDKYNKVILLTRAHTSY